MANSKLNDAYMAAIKKAEAGEPINQRELEKEFSQAITKDNEAAKTTPVEKSVGTQTVETVDAGKPQYRNEVIYAPSEGLVSLARKKTKAITAEKELDNYLKSDEYKQRTAEREKKLNQERFVKQLLSGTADIAEPQLIEDEKEAQLRAAAEQYRAEADAEEDQRVTAANLEELESWSEEDRIALEQYAVNQIGDQNMTTEMVGILPTSKQQAAGLIAKYGQKRVDEMAETYMRQQNAQLAQQVEESARQEVNDSLTGYGVRANLKSVAANTVGGVVGTVGQLQGWARRTGQYKTLDPNATGTIGDTYTGAVRGQTAQNISGDVYDENGNLVSDGGKLRGALSVGYQGVMAMADTIARGYLGGGAFGGAALAATSTFSQTMADASRQGATPEQAALLATASAGIEALSEKIPLDNLIDTAKGGKQAVGDIVKKALAQAGVEATTEEISLIGTLLAEAAILQEKSGYRQTVATQMVMGKSLEEAKQQAAMEIWNEVVNTAFVSAVSGGMSSAGASTAAYIADGINSKRNTQAAPEITQQPQSAQQGGEAVQGETPTQAETQAQTVTDQTMTEQERVKQSINNELQQASETSSVKEQLRNSQDSLNNMDSVADIQTPQSFSEMNKSDKMNWVIEKLRPTNYKVDRKGFGVINFASKQLKSAFNYFKKGSAEEAAFEALPYVLENGAEISSRADHKGREYGTVTFAAPVTINGKRGNMAVVVKQTTDNYYKVHRILSPDGSVFNLTETTNEAESTPAGESPSNGSLATPIDSASTNSVPQNNAEVNGNSADSELLSSAPHADTQEQSAEGGQQPNIKGTGAAERNFTGKADYQDLLYEGNVQRDRPGDVRPVEIPKKDPYDRNVSEFVGNAYGAEVTSDRMADEIESLVQEGALGFDTRTNKQSLEDAYDAIYGKDGQKGKGESATRTAITKNIANGRLQDGDIEKAMILYAKYAGRKSQRAQDSAAELMVDLATMANMSGRNLQLFKLLRRMTPEGQLMTVQKNVQRYVDSLNEGRSAKKQADVEIPDELERDFMTATTDEDREAAADAIYKNVASQIKPTLGEAWDAWRNLAMLGNPKTHIRNIAGSAAFRPYVSVKRAIGAGIERLTVEQKNRTKAVLGVSKESRALLTWAKSDAKSKSAMDSMDFSGYTGDEGRNAIQDARKLLPGKLETVRKKNMELMEGADMFFKQREYAYSLASFLKARGYTAADIQKGTVPQSVLTKGRELAVKEAQKATFNDRNRFSDAISKLRCKGDNGWSKALNAVAKGAIPFARTPANILVRAKEYSPVELAHAIKTLKHDVKSGKANVSDGIDQIASGLTGTGAMVLGSALAAGLIPGVRLVGKIEDEDELREGAQEYSIQIGDEYYGIGWLAPANMPLFIGANLYSSLSKKELEGDLDVWDVISSLGETASDVIDPMLELSMLATLGDMLETASYEDNYGDMALSMIATAATSYFTQGLPTVLGQAEQATEATKSTVYSNADNTVQRAFERTVGSATKRIPGVDLYQTDKIDEWGNVVKNEGGAVMRAVNAFLNPFTTSKAKNDALTKEISRLNEVQPESVSPRTAAKTISFTDVNGERHSKRRLTEQEYNTLATVQGQTAQEVLSAIIETESYKALNDDQKAQIFEYVYDYAKEKARAQAIQGYPELSGWMSGIEGKEVNTIIEKTVKSSFDGAVSTLKNAWRGDYDDAESVAQLEEAYKAYSNLDEEQQEAVMEDVSTTVKDYISARKLGIAAEKYAPILKTSTLLGDGMDALVEAMESGEENSGALDELELAFQEYKNLSAASKNSLNEKISSRNEYYLAAREVGTKTEVFAELYQSYRSIDGTKDLSITQKAHEWATVLEKAVDKGSITEAQKDVMKGKMVFRYSMQAETEKFDEVIEAGLETDTAKQIVDLILNTEGTGSVNEETGKKTVRDVDKWETLAKSNLTEEQKDIAIKLYMDDYDPSDESPDKAELKYNYARQELGMTAEEYVEAWGVNADGGKKEEKKEKWKALGYSEAEAEQLYRLFSATGRTKIDVEDWHAEQYGDDWYEKLYG